MKIKNYIAMVVCVLLSTHNLLAQATLGIENFHIMPGETRKVSINMTNTVAIRAFQVLVDLPDNVQMVARPTISALRNGIVVDEFGERKAAMKSLNYRVRANGDCMIVVNASDAVPFEGSEGAVLTLTLKANEKAMERSEEIHLKNMELVFADGITYVRPDDAVCTVDVCGHVTNLQTIMAKLNGEVDVYNLNGVKVKTAIPVHDLKKELPQGVYVIEGTKVYVNK